MHCWHHLSLKEIQFEFFWNSKPDFYFEQRAGWISAYIEFSFNSRTNITCTLGMPTHLPTALVILCKNPDNVGLFPSYARMRKNLRMLKGLGGYQFSVSSEVSLRDLPKKRFINGMTIIPLCSPVGQHTSPQCFQCPSLTEQLDISCTTYIYLPVHGVWLISRNLTGTNTLLTVVYHCKSSVRLHELLVNIPPD